MDDTAFQLLIINSFQCGFASLWMDCTGVKSFLPSPTVWRVFTMRRANAKRNFFLVFLAFSHGRGKSLFVM